MSCAGSPSRVAGGEGEEALEGQLGVGGGVAADVGGEDADQVDRVAEPDGQLQPLGAARTGGAGVDGQALDLELLDVGLLAAQGRGERVAELPAADRSRVDRERVAEVARPLEPEPDHLRLQLEDFRRSWPCGRRRGNSCPGRRGPSLPTWGSWGRRRTSAARRRSGRWRSRPRTAPRSCRARSGRAGRRRSARPRTPRSWCRPVPASRRRRRGAAPPAPRPARPGSPRPSPPPRRPARRTPGTPESILVRMIRFTLPRTVVRSCRPPPAIERPLSGRAGRLQTKLSMKIAEASRPLTVSATGSGIGCAPVR